MQRRSLVLSTLLSPSAETNWMWQQISKSQRPCYRHQDGFEVERVLGRRNLAAQVTSYHIGTLAGKRSFVSIRNVKLKQIVYNETVSILASNKST